MNRPSALVLVVGCLALVSAGVPFAPSSAFAQETGQTEGLPEEHAVNPDPGEGAGGAVAEPPGSPPDDDPDEVEPGTGGGNDDEGVAADEAMSRSPAEAPAGDSQAVAAL